MTPLVFSGVSLIPRLRLSIGTLIAVCVKFLFFDDLTAVMVLSEVVVRLMMMSGLEALSCPAERGQAAASRLAEPSQID
jgi:hypothetical protein